MIVTTESGSRYEIESDRVRRVNRGAVKRGDNEWQPLLSFAPNPPVIGEVLWFTVESLARYGADDYGTPASRVARETTRRTTAVVSVEGAVCTGKEAD